MCSGASSPSSEAGTLSPWRVVASEGLPPHLCEGHRPPSQGGAGAGPPCPIHTSGTSHPGHWKGAEEGRRSQCCRAGCCWAVNHLSGTEHTQRPFPPGGGVAVSAFPEGLIKHADAGGLPQTAGVGTVRRGQRETSRRDGEFVPQAAWGALRACSQRSCGDTGGCARSAGGLLPAGLTQGVGPGGSRSPSPLRRSVLSGEELRGLGQSPLPWPGAAELLVAQMC